MNILGDSQNLGSLANSLLIAFGIIVLLVQVYYLFTLKAKKHYAMDETKKYILDIVFITLSFLVSLGAIYTTLMVFAFRGNFYATLKHEHWQQRIPQWCILVMYQIFPAMLITFIVKFLILRKFRDPSNPRSRF